MKLKSLPVLLVFLFFPLNVFALEDEGPYLPKNKLSNTATDGVLLLDDFEETIINDATFQNWTTENLEGWNYWHLIPSGGLEGSQCMRFEISGIVQNDWLISNPINCSNVDQLAVSFDIYYSGSGPRPRLFYTTEYNGDSGQSDWTELNYSLGPNENEWYSVDELVIENPGEVIYFAFHYQSDPQNVILFLLDNFSVTEYSPPPDYELIVNSEYCQFFAGSENAGYWDEISADIDNWVMELCSFWDRPGRDPVLNEGDIIKIYLTDRDEAISSVGTAFPDWKFGGFIMPDQLYLSLPPGGINDIYEGSFSKLTKNIYGDVNRDGRIGIEDSIYILWKLSLE